MTSLSHFRWPRICHALDTFVLVTFLYLRGSTDFKPSLTFQFGRVPGYVAKYSCKFTVAGRIPEQSLPETAVIHRAIQPKQPRKPSAGRD